MSPPAVDLVIVFRSHGHSKEEIQEAEHEYTQLIHLLDSGGLVAAGKKGEKPGQILVLIWCPKDKLTKLVEAERRSDFLHGLSAINPPTLDSAPLSPARRLRLVYSYLTSAPKDGGLGVLPGANGWHRVESVMALHDKKFNHHWIASWTRNKLGFGVGMAELDKVKEQFGESLALYFAFLSSYTQSLMIPSALGCLTHYFSTSFDPLYSILLALWSVAFIEWYGIRERKLAVKWGTRGAVRVERRRVLYNANIGERWWTRDAKTAAALPIIFLFAVMLSAVVTTIFIFEAFASQLYRGPGHEYMSYVPTIIFSLLVPRFLAYYQTYAVRLTNWENHVHQSEYDRSLTLKTFALSAIVAYGGLALSAFVYVPYGEQIMHAVYAVLFGSSGKDVSEKSGEASWHIQDIGEATRLLDPNRLRNQMFALTVTSQGVNFFMEVGLPIVMRFVDAFRNGKGPRAGSRKKVKFEDEKHASSVVETKEERELMDQINAEVALPQYELFGDYAEMVTQFGYVTLWSSIYPLAPVMSLLNNWIEARSDAFKITVNGRRPIPTRADTMGPWLETLSFMTWLGALTNTALVFLFRQRLSSDSLGFSVFPSFIENDGSACRSTIMATALLLALTASHLYIVMRSVVRYILVRALWEGSAAAKESERMDEEVKGEWLKQVEKDIPEVEVATDGKVETEGKGPFWEDRGLDEIRSHIKKE
ncbi:hypothetical protein BOTBODRAFT_121703 [Botryobasidium botryosum FD-172 SS1]|uniref:DUF590-domain-containing protein n=1 Tax=Botryobasidium botryosum (strain FD-172 SS1) TaxID=930990 RepID=A0A067LSS2_BOTB1|nr:hypothetical protein BOTBODRAFT_121703 [Botryobasidium botryosum FD-172 SS1]